MMGMEPINLITGAPGAGKTLFALHLLELCQKEGLTAYHYNVKGLDPELAEHWPGPIEKWQELPSGSVLVVDEAHSVFPVRRNHTSVPDHIAALAEIRHRGIRLIVIDQDPGTLDIFIRKRVGTHYHLVNRTGHNAARLFSNRGLVDNPRKDSWASGESEIWRYPAHLFGMYDSAEVHLKRPRIPKKAIFLGVAIVFTLVALIGAGLQIASMWGKSESGDLAPAIAAGLVEDGGIASSLFQGQPRGDQLSPWQDAESFAKAHTPLVPGVPWSAPVFSGMAPTTVPDLHCIIIGNSATFASTCRCFTEQITPLDIDHQTCRAAAKGGTYNPYRLTRHQGSRWEQVTGERRREQDQDRHDEREERGGRQQIRRWSHAAPPPVQPYSGIR